MKKSSQIPFKTHPPVIGSRRVAAAFIDLSLILVPTMYLTLLVAAITKTPVQISWGIVENINEVWFFLPFLIVFFLLHYVLSIKMGKNRFVGKQICGLVTVRNDTEQAPTRVMKIKKRFIQLLLLFVVIPPLDQWAFVHVWLFVAFVLTKLIGASNLAALHLFPSLERLQPSPLFPIGTLVLSFLVYYFPLFLIWKRRGLPDIVAGTKVISVDNKWSKKNMYGIFIILSALWLGIFFVEAHIPSDTPPVFHATNVELKTDKTILYTSLQGWSIHYNPEQFSPFANGTNPSWGGVDFNYHPDTPTPCISTYQVDRFIPMARNDPQNPLNYKDPNMQKTSDRPIQLGGYPGQQLVFEATTPVQLGDGKNIKKVMDIIETKNAIYYFEYDVFQANYGGSDYNRFPPEECQQNGEAIEKLFQTFHIQQ